MKLDLFGAKTAQRQAAREEAARLWRAFGEEARAKCQARIDGDDNDEARRYFGLVLEELSNTARLEGLAPSQVKPVAAPPPRPADPGEAPAPPAASAGPLAYTAEELRRAQVMAMRLRQSMGAPRARAHCQELLGRADAGDRRVIDLVLRSIGGA